MTIQDYLAIFWDAQEVGLAAFMMYLSVVSGYLVVAYLVGAKLDRFQTSFISCVFVMFALYPLWGVVEYWTSAEEARQALIELKALEKVELNHLGINAAIPALPMGLLGIAGSLVFMWDVRRKQGL
ncbi:MAG: hypothetical protein ABJN62_19555 [Halioglobus sp.]